jgi:putative tryptophan/tyrosine transport system substrate-binding protein
MAIQIGRRHFISALGGAAAWPLAARAQQPVIGFLHAGTASGYAPMTAAFSKSLSEAGFPTIKIEYRWAEGHLDHLVDLAADLMLQPPAVIFAGGGLDAVLVAKKATNGTVPIVFANATDPVASGLVASLDRPGGNITGITFLIDTLAPKEFEVLNEILPKAAVIGVLPNRNAAIAASQLKDLQVAANALARQIRVFRANDEGDFDKLFVSLLQAKAGGLVVGADTFFFSWLDQIVGLAARNAIPTAYPWREAVTGGGLVSYGASVTDAYKLAGSYVGRILKGEVPASLPVQQSTKTELVINLKTAKTLGLIFPLTLLGRADEVIE